MRILEALKSETMTIHQELEQVPLLKRIMTREITLREYKQLLLIFYQFIYPRETNVKSTFPYLLKGREKSGLLLADLSGLSYLDDADLNSSVCNEISPTISTEAEVFGYLYVMEGATLGGQFITQALKQNSHLPSNLTIQYFNAYGNDTRSKWLDFTRVLCAKNVTLTQYDQVIRSAVETFKGLLHWVKENTVNDIS